MLICRHTISNRPRRTSQPESKTLDWDHIANDASSSDHATRQGCGNDEAEVAEEVKPTGGRKGRQKSARLKKKSKSTMGRQNFVRIDRKVRDSSVQPG